MIANTVTVVLIISQWVGGANKNGKIYTARRSKKLCSSDKYEPDVQWCLSELRDILEIIGDMSGDRLRELIEADQGGRCVVLPCKNWLELVFGEQEIFYGIDMDYLENPVREITVRNETRFFWYDGWRTVLFNGTDENGLDWEFSPDEIGKTVFLTREAAKKALEEMEESENGFGGMKNEKVNL